MTAPGLDLFVQEITELRDTAFADTVAAHEASDWGARNVSGSEWFAYARTLSTLYRTTSGEHGEPIDAQESPFDAINRAVADRQAVTR